MPVLEKDIEAKVVRYAKERGCLVRKMGGFGFAAWPDRLFVLPEGKTFWIEFKRPGIGKLSPGQDDMIRLLKIMGHIAYVVDDVERGKAIVEAELARRD